MSADGVQVGPRTASPSLVSLICVYGFLAALPLLVIGGIVLAVLVYYAEVGGAAAAPVTAAVAGGYAAALLGAFRAVGRIAAHFWPPLPLPGDIWNLGPPPVPKRSRNWPLRLRPRKAA